MSVEFLVARRRRAIRHLRITIDSLATLTTSDDIRARLIFERRYLDRAEQQLRDYEASSLTESESGSESHELVETLINTVKAHVKIIGFLVQPAEIVLSPGWIRGEVDLASHHHSSSPRSDALHGHRRKFQTASTS